MFIPALELRRYLQEERSESERDLKLVELATKWLSKRDCIYPKSTPLQAVIDDIVESYTKGLDILDPECFSKADLVEFAETYGLTKDPMVIKAIQACSF